MQRRSFMKGAGVATILAAAGAWRATGQGAFSAGEGPAYQPWKDWRLGTGDGTLMPLARAALLAASPHNTQPWLFKVTDTAIELYLDPRRTLGALDPYLREAWLGLGCALENLVLAAVAKGSSIDLTLVPGRLGPLPAGQGPVLAARVQIAACIQELDDLYEAIPRRHTYRGPCLPGRPVPAPFRDALAALPADEPEVRLFLFEGGPERDRLVAITAAANAELYADPEVLRDNGRWLRLDPDAVRGHRDGLTIDAFGLSPAAAGFAKLMPAWLLRRAVARGVAAGPAGLMSGAPLIGIIAVRDRYDRPQALRAGRIWQRAHLLATVHGLAGRPCNEAVEMIDHERALGRPARRSGLLAELLGGTEWQPTFLFYMGHPALPAGVSPRRPLGQALL